MVDKRKTRTSVRLPTLFQIGGNGCWLFGWIYVRSAGSRVGIRWIYVETVRPRWWIRGKHAPVFACRSSSRSGVGAREWGSTVSLRYLNTLGNLGNLGMVDGEAIVQIWSYCCASKSYSWINLGRQQLAGNILTFYLQNLVTAVPI
jgi:hypothetical protein